jgi:hypothetical protein
MSLGCVKCSVFRKTYCKWKKRDFGLSGNTYSPIKRNTKLIWEVRKFIEENKVKLNYGPLKIKKLVKLELNLDVSTTIIYRYYKRRRLIQKPQRRFSWHEPMKQHLTVKKAGEGVQMDVKYVYERGKRMFRFSVFDPFTLKYHFTVFTTKESANSIVAFLKAEKYF